MKNILFSLCILALAATACSKDEEGNQPPIPITDGQQLTAYADQTAVNGGNGIRFSTTAAWQATIAQSRAGTPDWITISPDHGDSTGEYTAYISLRPNTSGIDRSANISITFGATTLTIIVEQKAITQEEAGDEPSKGTPTTEDGLRCYADESDDFYTITGMAVSRGDVYLSGYVHTGKEGDVYRACYWKNGKLELLETGTSPYSSEAFAVFVYNDTVYIGGCADGDNPALWTNGKLKTLPGSGCINALYIKAEDEIYAAGNDYYPVYWRIRTRWAGEVRKHQLSESRGYATSIFVGKHS